MNWHNLLAWSLQIALVVAVAAATAAMLRVRVPGARLFYWQMVLLACLALPLVQPWNPEAVTGSVSVSMRIVQPVETAAHRGIPQSEAALWLIAAGVVARAMWLAAGFWRLRQYRRRSSPFGFRDGAALLVSHDISSPVTFGALRPVVLLPAQFPELEPRMQEAILCHELLHVRRRDWLFTIAEETVRTAFWFHPAVWWLLGQIQLAREQVVDRRTIETTRSREEYVDALLAIAGAKPQLDLAPAPLFLRKRHLKQRVVSVLKEVRMSKTRLVGSLAAGLGILIAACWLITATFPLKAAPEVVADAPGVTVGMGAATLMHRTPVVYPEAIRKQGIQGTVIVQLKIDSRGNVTDAQVLSGPDELRKSVLQSVLNWHLSREAAGSTQELSIDFRLPAEATKPGGPLGTALAPRPLAQAARLPEAASREPHDQLLKSITILGLSDQARAELVSRLPVREGDLFGPAQSMQVAGVIKDFDDHLALVLTPVAGGGSGLTIAPKEMLQQTFPPAPVNATLQPGPQRIRVGGQVQAAKLISQVKPVYPVAAKEAGTQGTVRLNVLIGKDGTVQNLVVISGDPLLVPATMEAVRQWVYQPTLLNGAPVEVASQIDVNFTLSQ